MASVLLSEWMLKPLETITTGQERVALCSFLKASHKVGKAWWPTLYAWAQKNWLSKMHWQLKDTLGVQTWHEDSFHCPTPTQLVTLSSKHTIYRLYREFTLISATRWFEWFPLQVKKDKTWLRNTLSVNMSLGWSDRSLLPQMFVKGDKHLQILY